MKRYKSANRSGQIYYWPSVQSAGKVETHTISELSVVQDAGFGDHCQTGAIGSLVATSECTRMGRSRRGVCFLEGLVLSHLAPLDALLPLRFGEPLLSLAPYHLASDGSKYRIAAIVKPEVFHVAACGLDA